MLRAIELLKTPIPASRRIGVTIDFETMKKVAIMFTRREHGVLSDVCRKYTQRDIVGEGANCLILFDEILVDHLLVKFIFDIVPGFNAGLVYGE